MYCARCAPAAPADDTVLVPVEDLQISRAFTYFADDPRWPVKVIIGSLFVLASVLIFPYFLVLGYQLEIVRNVARGEDCVLPEWVDLRGKFVEGASMFLIGLVYAAPLIVVMAAVTALGILAGGTGSPARGFLNLLAVVGFLIGWLVVVVYAVALRLASPAIAGTFAKTASIRSTLQPGVIIGLITSDLKAYLLVLLLTVVVTSTIAFIGVLAFCIGVFLTTFYAALVNAHLIGQLTRLNPLPGGQDAA